MRVEEFLGLGMGLGPGEFPVPIPGSKSRELEELDEVGGAVVVVTAGIGVRMEEEEGWRERGVRVAERECVHVHVQCMHKIMTIQQYIHVHVHLLVVYRQFARVGHHEVGHAVMNGGQLHVPTNQLLQGGAYPLDRR